MNEQFGPEAIQVLRVLREKAMDGYTLQSKTKLETQPLTQALDQLQSSGVIVIKGDLNPYNVGEVYVYVPPTLSGYVDMLLGTRRYNVAR